MDYTIKQVWVITRLKFGLKYRKTFIRYHEEPPEARQDFKKKTWDIDIESEDVVVLDESRAQTNTQTTKCLCSPNINCFKDLNIIYKTEKDLEQMQ